MKYFLLILFSVFLSSLGFAQTDSLPESNPQAKKAPLGSVSFFLSPKQPMIKGESIHVGEKEKAFFCVQLNAEDPRIKNDLHYLRRIEITLEGGNPSQKMVGLTKSWNRILLPDSNGCFIGEIRIADGIPPGKYKLAEVDLWMSSSSSISLREEIPEMIPQGMIEVESPNHDLKPPVIEKIVTKTPLINDTTFRGKRGRGRIKFQVVATDSISGVNFSTLRVFFRFLVDKNLVDILESKCLSFLPNLYFNCELKFSRGEPQLKTRTVELVLDSMILSDKIGNETELKEPESLKALFSGKILHYIFYPDQGFKKKELKESHEEFQEDLEDVMKR